MRGLVPVCLAVLAPVRIAAAGTCSFQSTTATLVVSAYQGGTLSVGASGAIRLDGVPCEEATVTNTDLIQITGVTGDVSPFVISKPSRFAPGLTPEDTGASEIEFAVSDVRNLDIILTAYADTLHSWGLDGFDFMNDDDQDLAWPPGQAVTVLRVFAKGGDDTIELGCSTCRIDVYGGNGNDTIHGGRYAYGENGDDQLYSGGGSVLNGGPGNDLLVGSGAGETFDQGASADGADTIIGGGGSDTVDYSQRTTGINVTVGNGAADDGEPGEGDSVTLGAGAKVVGGSGDDVLVGSSVDDKLFGGPGNDDIYGEGGRDTLRGDDGDDFLDGGAGRDTVLAGMGNDILEGGTSADHLYGDSGNDELHDAGGTDDFYGGSGDDLIFNADGLADTVDCGDGNDTPQFESFDTFSACELP